MTTVPLPFRNPKSILRNKKTLAAQEESARAEVYGMKKGVEGRPRCGLCQSVGPKLRCEHPTGPTRQRIPARKSSGNHRGHTSPLTRKQSTQPESSAANPSRGREPVLIEKSALEQGTQRSGHATASRANVPGGSCMRLLLTCEYEGTSNRLPKSVRVELPNDCIISPVRNGASTFFAGDPQIVVIRSQSCRQHKPVASAKLCRHTR